MKYFYITSIIIGIILLGVIALTAKATALATELATESITLGDAGVPNVLASLTNTSIALTANTSTLVLNGNSGRLYADICSVPTNTTSTFLTISSNQNASGTTIGVPATLNNGIYLATGTCYDISSKNQAVGLINGYANASNTLSVIYQ